MAAAKRSSRSSQRSKARKAGGGERRSVIVTFKPKDKRPDGDKDKLEVLSDVISSDVTFLTAGAVEQGAAIGLEMEAMAYDVNEYEAPIVTLSLTDSEIEALEKNGNVAAVEDDGLMYALEVAAPGVALRPPAHRRGSALAARRDDSGRDQPDQGPAGLGLLAWQGDQGCGPGYRDRRHTSGPRAELPRRHQLRRRRARRG